MRLDIGRRNPLHLRVTNNGCWECTSIKPKSDGRYYHITVGSRTDGTRKPVLLHRYIYEYFIGEIPKGMVVRHKCDNVLCINPNHLETGTHKDNMNDMKVRGRSTKGEKNPSAKLTDKEVEEIIRLYDEGKYNQTELGNMFNVSQRHISNIVRGINRNIKTS